MFRKWRENVRQSLRLKIWLSIQFATLVVLVLYLLAHFVIESKTTTQIVDLQAKLRAEELLNSTFHMMENMSDPTTAHPLPMENLPQDKVTFHILDKQQVIRYSNHAERIGGNYLVFTKDPLDPEGPIGMDRWQAKVVNGEVLLSAPLLNENRCQRCHTGEENMLGYVEITFPLHEVVVLLRQSQWYHIISGILLLVMFSLITLTTLRKLFIQRMGTLAVAIQDIAAGNLSKRIQDGSTDEIGQVTKQLNVMLDEIAKRRQEEEASHRQEIHQFDRLATIGELVSGLAHEIRNPIAGISAAIQTLSRSVPNDDPTYEVFQHIRGNTDRLDTLVRNLLSYARMEKPQMIPMQLNEVVEQSLKIFSQETNAHCSVETHLAPNLPLVQGDPKLLQQVLLNIFINAKQAKGEGLRLLIETCHVPKQAVIHDTPEVLKENPFRCRHGVIQVRISDNGPGIPAENISTIFKPFFTTKPQGTGLGLSISTRIMRQHNGCLFARSQSTQGATMVLCIPTRPETNGSSHPIALS